MYKELKRAEGFTIVEFLIATAIFSLVMLLCSMAIIHIGRMFYKGMITNRTQDASRRIVDDIASGIQFGPRTINATQLVRTSVGQDIGGGVMAYSTCIGSIRYTYTPDAYLGAPISGGQTLRHLLWRTRLSGASNACATSDIDLTATNPGGLNGMEMLAGKMRLPLLTITNNGRLWTINIRIAYGDDPTMFVGDGLDATPSNRYRFCKSIEAGGQFCAISGFSTSVVKRL